MTRNWRFSLAVLSLGLALWLPVAFTQGIALPTLPALLALGLTAIYGERRSLYVPGYGALNLGECLYFGATLTFGPGAGALLTALFGLASDRINRKSPTVMVFNLGWSLVTFTAVGLVTRDAAPLELTKAIPGAVVYAVCAALLQALAQERFEDMPLRRTLRMQVQGMKLQAPAVLTLGVLCALLLKLSPWGVLMMIFPVEVSSAYVRIRELHRELQEAQARMLASGRQASLGVMAAGVAHEINNPLAAMATSLHMLRQGPDPACLELLEKGLERCRGITNRMLVYSRGPGRSEARSDVQAVVQDALLFAHLELQVDTELEQLPPVRCEPGELVQILTNLLTNARDAGAQHVHIRGEARQGAVELRVRDQGQGIAAEVRPRLFEPFFTTKPVGEGTGLGLFLSRGIAENAGGKLELVSTGPQGSCFALTLPEAAP